MKTDLRQRAIVILVACSLLVATTAASTTLFTQTVQAMEESCVDVEIVSITPIVYYPEVYVWNGQMHICRPQESQSGNSSLAMFLYEIVVRRDSDNASIPLLSVLVYLARSNMDYFPDTSVDAAPVKLAPLEEISLSLTWYEDGESSTLPANETGIQWMIYAGAQPLSAVDINPANNVMTDGNATAYSGLVCDFNGDGTVDIFDALILSRCYGTSEGQAGYNPICNLSTFPDQTGLQAIDIFDAVLFSQDFNTSMP